jgi:hypothetical protein
MVVVLSLMCMAVVCMFVGILTGIWGNSETTTKLLMSASIIFTMLMIITFAVSVFLGI